MYRKSIQSGLLEGILLALTLGLVIVEDEVVRLLPGERATPLLPRDLVRTFALILAAILLLFLGILAAMRVRPARPREGFLAGATSGWVAGWVVTTFLFFPLVVLREGLPPYQQVLLRPEIVADEARLAQVAWSAWQLSVGVAFLVPLAGLGLGGIEGLAYAWLRRNVASFQEGPALPLLLREIRGGWTLPVERDEHILRAGLWGGTMVGTFLALEVLLLTLQALSAVPLPANRSALLEQGRLLALAGPLAVLVPPAFLLWGGSGILLLKDPPTRFRSRLAAGTLSGAVAGTFLSTLALLPALNAGLALLPLWLRSGGERPPFLPEQLALLARNFFFLYLPIPLALLFLSALAGFLLGLPFALLSAYLWPRRPVDRAIRLVGRLRQQPETLLPELYALFQHDRQAGPVLRHLAYLFQKEKDPGLATLAAAYQALYEPFTYPAESLEEILETSATVLAATPERRWSREIGELHRFLDEGLQARNLLHLAAIRPLPEEHTSSLPPPLIRVWERLSAVVHEVKKAQRVDDPNGRAIYLNRALEEVAAARRLSEEDMAFPHGRRPATFYPEQRVLAVLLPHWQAILHEALRDLRGRALLRAELVTRRMSCQPRLKLHLRLTNAGLNVAERVRLYLLPGPDYQLTEESEARLEVLLPGEERTVELALEPRNSQRMRVVVQILYDDAVDENREMVLADEVVFLAEERPFQRIFPIPYVTGTPLKTKEMFFGRQDVFTYVREHLLGAYQNNIIVLHGQRRTGKTSVLYRLSEVLQDTHYCVLLDMQGMAVRNEAELFYTFSDEIAYALGREGIPVQLPPRQEYEAQPEFTFRSRFLRNLYPALGEKRLLLMFDEFEELQGLVEAVHLRADIFPFLRNLMQHEEKVDFLFSGTHKLEELAAEYWSILFNIATYKKISFLEPDEARRLITEPVAPYGMEYDSLAVEQILRVTAGHPFLTQLVCHEMVAYHNEVERSYLTVADVDAVLERIAERGEAHFKYIWSEADPQERAAMLALAELLAYSEGASAEEISALSARRGRPLEGEAALSALLRLESRDIVVRLSPGSERFRFYIDLVRRWIAVNPQLADQVSTRP